MKLKHYAEFLIPGIIFSESTMREVESRSVPPVWPKRTFGYRFVDRYISETPDGDPIKGPAKNPSPWTIVAERVRTREEVEREQPGSILACNMRGNGIARVAMTAWGQAIPLNDEDCVVTEAEVVREAK